MALVWLGKFACSVVGIIWCTVLGKIWDAILGNIWDIVLGKIGEYVAAPIKRQFKYMCCFDSNIKELEAQLEMFQRTRQLVQLRLGNDRANVRIIDPNVEAWLKRANEVASEGEGITQEKPKVKEGCWNGWCPNLKLHYSLSRKAVKNTEVVVQLQAAGVSYTQTSYSLAPTTTETIPDGGFESRRLTMEEIIKALKHNEIYLIGICGMGGIGKTTMVKEVAKRAKEDSLFDEVAMAVVSQEPNPTNIQACIADMLDLKLVDRDSPIVRANLLHSRLLKDNKKILLILDDVWAEFNLEDMGISLGGSNKNLKMLYTSRIQALWHDSQIKKEIAVELLSEDEAWQLFREKAGDSADAQDLQPIAKQIVNECGHLPLALVIIGSALSKKSKGNFIKDIWEDMLDQLTCARNTPPGNSLSSSLELSYKYVEDEEAKRLFLLCCLFQEDEDIRIEELARYGLGLSLFDGINEMGKVRRRVVVIIDDLKSRYLLLDSEVNECVKVHDVVRDMGISIASKVKWALVRHGAVTEWPKTMTHEHYTAISVISNKIKDLPDGLKYANLEFLMLRCNELEKLPPNFFEGMGKLKVLELKNFHGILTFQPLKNLTMLALEEFCGMLDNVSVIGNLQNLEILSFRKSGIKELPEEIRGLVNLRLLDLSRTYSLERILPGVISHLLRLEELYVLHSKFCYWEGEGQEKGRNANLKEFESLSYLNTLEIVIKRHVVVPKLSILGKLKKFKVAQEDLYKACEYKMVNRYQRQLLISAWNWDTPAGRGGLDMLLRSSDFLILSEEGSNYLVQLLFPDGIDSLHQLKYLDIEYCDTPECIANTISPVPKPPNATAVFPILEKLFLIGLHNLREICHGSVPMGSFGQLTEIHIWDCEKMEEVIWKERRDDVHVAPNKIVFPKLERLALWYLPSLVGFCRGIEQIDFPQLKELRLRDLRKVNCLFDNNNNLSSNSLFPEKVSLPNLEVLIIFELENLETLGHGLLSMGALSKLRDFLVRDCSKLLCVFPSQLVPMLQDFETLCVESCNLLEEVFESERVDSNEPDLEILYSALQLVQLRNLPRLNYISKRDPMVFKYIQTLEIDGCDSLRYVFAPTVTKSIPQLRELKIWSCKMLSRIVAEENGMGESSVDEAEFPQLESLELRYLPNLRRFCNSTHPLELPRLSKMHIWFCRGMNAFSLGQVSAPNLSLPGILWNGDLNSAIQLLQKGRKKEEDEEEERRKWWEGVEERRKRDEEQRKTEERRKREEEERKWEEEWRME